MKNAEFIQQSLERLIEGILGGDAWVAQSVGRPTSAQVMISWSVSSSPMSGSVLIAQNLEPASDSVSPSLSAPPLLVHSLSENQTNIKKQKKGAPGWLSRLSVRLQLRSRSRGP